MAMISRLGYATADQIVFQGTDLCKDLIGTISLGDFVYFCATGNRPERGEGGMLAAVMVAGAEHGITPSSLAARLTYIGAPEAVQGMVAAGLLGGGSVYLGATERVAELLARLQAIPGEDADVAVAEVSRAMAARERLPGFGHPVHKRSDPRTAALLDLARKKEMYGRSCSLIEAVHGALEEATGKPICLNAAGSSAAILLDIGVKPSMVRSVALAGRAIGLMCHLREEAELPLADEAWMMVAQAVEYKSD